MIKLAFRLPRKLTVAFSGGIDSVAAAHFLANNHDVSLAFFHHGTQDSEKAELFVRDFSKKFDLPLTIGYIKSFRPKELSLEEHWRNERYNFLENVDDYVVTAHHLNDCVETYVHSAMHGTIKTIPFHRNEIVHRPFLLNRKYEFENYVQRKNLSWIEDSSNFNLKYTRNFIRCELMPNVLKVNPGINTTVSKILKTNLRMMEK